MNPLAIRQLTIAELPLCEPYGKAFHEEKQVPGTFNMTVFIQNWTLYLEKCNGVLLGLWNEDKLVGGLGGMIVPDITTGTPTATEFFLFIDKDYRGSSAWYRLIQRFREYGKSRGAQRLRMEQLILPAESDDLAKMLRENGLACAYFKMGLRPIEIGWDGPIESLT